MKRGSRDGLAAKGLLDFTKVLLYNKSTKIEGVMHLSAAMHPGGMAMTGHAQAWRGICLILLIIC